MADAVTRLFPGVKVTIGPCIDDGFFYDFDFERPFMPEDLERIEGEMKKILKENLPFVRKEISKKEAIEFFRKKGEKYKIEIIEGIPDSEKISLYQVGEFVDLCKGPHVAKTGEIKTFKLLSAAGSYWRGDEKRERLQRIYGTVFENQKDLDGYLKRLEEAKKRDHRKLGKELGLFTFHPESPASPFFYPKGALVYRAIIDYLRDLYVKEGYDEVITPEILDVALWERSGHLEHFRENMYFTEIEERQFAVKPMNCPGHCLLFGERKWSYRELPVRFADFGRLHRFERSGVVHGLTRVRSFCQDDAHIYCTPEQMDGEITSFLRLVEKVYADFGFTEVSVNVATRPSHFLGTKEVWDRSEEILQKTLQQKGVAFEIKEGEGAFYGPKIEFCVKDVLMRPWQLGTLQVDYSMPERFNLEYVTSAGGAARPVLLHRAVLGSLERFLGILVEHCGGAFPLWLAPVQIRLLTITDETIPFAKEVRERLTSAGFRVESDFRGEKLGLKIREAQVAKVPYMGVIGGKEATAKSVALRHRTQGDLGSLPIDDVIQKLKQDSAIRKS